MDNPLDDFVDDDSTIHISVDDYGTVSLLTSIDGITEIIWSND